MKKRYLYSIMYGLPGLGVAAFAAIFTMGPVAGFFWIFVFGDGDWPFWTSWVINGVGIIAFIIALFIIVKLGFTAGKKREIENTRNITKHLIISVAAFVCLILAMFFFQQGYVFTEPSSVTCRNICLEKGYDGTSTGLSPEFNGKTICSCWSDESKQWEEVETIDYK